MTAALIFRGHSFRKPHDGYSARSWGVDWRKCIDSQRRFLIEPLRAKYDLHVLLCHYDTELSGEVNRDYAAEVWRTAYNGATQRQTALQALDVVIDYNREFAYDFVVMTRFDLEFLATPWEQPGFRPECVNWLWREWNVESWNDHRRVPDPIHMMPGCLLEGFRQGVATAPSEDCLHLIYWPVARAMGEENLNVMNQEGFLDSNTDHCPNSIYRMVRVP